ncbi:hypothetical protein [Brevibacillus laterosporus]
MSNSCRGSKKERVSNAKLKMKPISIIGIKLHLTVRSTLLSKQRKGLA